MLFPRLLLRMYMNLRLRLLLQAGCLLLLTTVVGAQSRAPIPTLTSEDVIGTKQVVSKTPATEIGKNSSQSEKALAKDAVSTAPVKSAEDPKKKAEKDWNERLKKAREKLSELERRADQAELQMTQLRNQLFSATSRGPELNSQLNARIGEFTEQRNRLRAEAQIAQQEVTTLQSEGRNNSYQVIEATLVNEKGEPDVKAYQVEQEKLQNELRDAQARVEVLQIRLNSVQGEVLKKGNGDNFTLNRLRQERERTTAELAETRTRIEELNSQLQSHRQKATAAGVPLGTQ